MSMNKRLSPTYLILAYAIGMILVIVGCTSGSFSGKNLRKKQKLVGPKLYQTDRVLVIAPHPDDETIAPAGLIQECLKRKIPVKVVLMNNGDGYRRCAIINFKTLEPTIEDYKRLGYIRHQESLNAMTSLGLSEKDVIYLSYADGSTNSLFEKNWDYSDLHKGTNGDTHATYPFAYEPDAPYCGENVVKDLQQIFDDLKPNVVIYPDPEDDHHDHWATSAFVEYVVSKIKYDGRQYTYLVHKGFDWPFPWLYSPESTLEPPPELVGLDARWLRFKITTDEEQKKETALGMYESQKLMAEPFLKAFVRTNELFACYPDIVLPPVKKEPDFFKGRIMPSVAFRDPAKDALTRELEGFGDIIEVSFAYDRKKVWMALETRRGIAPDIVYGYHVRIFKGDDIKRIDVNAKEKVARIGKEASNSIFIDKQVPMKTMNNRMVIELPYSYFDNADVVMLNVDSFNSQDGNHRRIDRTAWRRLYLDNR
jgi:LmbE family N-acetylglucosaminyl deacetylase